MLTAERRAVNSALSLTKPATGVHGMADQDYTSADAPLADNRLPDADLDAATPPETDSPSLGTGIPPHGFAVYTPDGNLAPFYWYSGLTFQRWVSYSHSPGWESCVWLEAPHDGFIDTLRANAERWGLSGVTYELAISAQFSHACAYCGERQVFAGDIGRSGLAVDHIIPRSRGGGNTLNNVVPCCSLCNSKKGSKLPIEWLSAPAYMKFTKTHMEVLAELEWERENG